MNEENKDLNRIDSALDEFFASAKRQPETPVLSDDVPTDGSTSVDFTTILGEQPNKDELTSHSVEVGSAMRIGQIVSNILLFAVIVAMIGGATLFALSDNPDKAYFGKFRVYTVLTQSMRKTDANKDKGFKGGFDKDALILVKKVEQTDVRVGDIITFSTGEQSTSFLTHRVVDIRHELNGTEGLFFVTRGDANNADDPTFPADYLIGKKIFSIPKIGKILFYVRENLVVFIILLFSIFALFVVISRLFSPSSSNKKPTNKVEKLD